MKKILYAVAALALFAGCAKDVNETAVKPNGGKIKLDLTITPESDSRAIFDGDSHITWENGDYIGVLVAAEAQSAKALNAVAQYKIADATAEIPAFSGTLEVDDSDFKETYYLFGMYPYSAISNTSVRTIEGMKIKLPSAQASTQERWDGKADVMVIKPEEVTATETNRKYDSWEEIYYYTWKASANAKFAHIFGFGEIAFNGVPADCENEIVNKVIITAIGDSKNLTGEFQIDLDKDIMTDAFAITDVNPDSSITLVGDGATAVKDFKAWFVANPGNYDVNIEIITNNHKLNFERKNLVIERAKIAKPVVNYKSGDAIASTTVDLTGGKLWEHDTATSYNNDKDKYFIKNKETSAVWGTSEGAEPVEFALSYTSIKGETYASSSQTCSYFGTRYVQRFYTSNFTFGNVQLTSAYPFKGINNIKVNSGISYGSSDECSISVFVVTNDGIRHQIGTAQKVKADSSNYAGTDYYFESTETIPEGQVQIVWGDASTNGIYLFIGQIAINPAPGISFEAEKLNLQGSASTGTTKVSVVCATNEPSVSTDVDWLKVSYKDGEITYTVEENTGDETRTGNIIVSATGNSTATAQLAVSQLSSKVAEFKLSVTAALLNDAIKKAAKDYTDADESNKLADNTALSFDITLPATIVGGTDTKDITLQIGNILYESVDKSYMKFKTGSYWSGGGGTIINSTSLSAITKIEINNNYYSSYAIQLKLGQTADNLTTKTPEKTELGNDKYYWLCESDVNEGLGFFSYTQGSSASQIYSFDVTFITKK